MSNEMTTETVQAEAQADACVKEVKLSEVVAALRAGRFVCDVPGLLVASDEVGVSCRANPNTTERGHNTLQLSWELGSQAFPAILYETQAGKARALRDLAFWAGVAFEREEGRGDVAAVLAGLAGAADAKGEGDEA
ncbi:MAG: hypothetical protein IJA63_05965 [Akkermansia sp.]|nr:hypothetical protein [Akkermansia sp.]